MSTYLFSYNQNSKGSKDLSRELNIPRLKHRGSLFQGSPQKTVINWGSSEVSPEVLKCRLLNTVNAIALASNKLFAFQYMKIGEVTTVPWTNDHYLAQEWLAQGKTVFARTKLQGQGGDGIVQMDPEHPENHNTKTRLYTQYVPKKDEFRVHIMKSQDSYDAFLTQRKGLSPEFQGREDIDWRVRNLNNGFIFVRNDARPVPLLVIEEAKKAVLSLGLDFGAVDVIWNQAQEKAYILEVNCAPGLSGTTITDYAEAFKRNFGV